jgi:hypothetical protein
VKWSGVDNFFSVWLFQHLVIFSPSGFFTFQIRLWENLALGNCEHWVRGSCFCKEPPEFQQFISMAIHHLTATKPQIATKNTSQNAGLIVAWEDGMISSSLGKEMEK